MTGPSTLQLHLRENAPMYGVLALLVLTFFTLAALTPDSRRAPVAAATWEHGATPPPLPGLNALPAAADDTVVLSDLAPLDARARNAIVELAAIGPGTAAPFRFRGSSDDRRRARECLALAGMAEAGSGDGDQRAVMQVILNRVRHPAFAKTVCGVVFEGSQRATGCQFSFTCDGSLARRYSDAAWTAARQRAEQMLGGATYAPVGNATHFHADFVYPWWSPKLDKVAQVGPHIFFRWRGPWGAATALSARYAGSEPDPLPLRQRALEVAAAHPLPVPGSTETLLETGSAVRSITASPAAAKPAQASDSAAPGSPAPGVHFVLVSASDSPAALVDKARMLCPGDRYCQVYGWDDPTAIPAKLPISPDARRALRFSFLPARAGNAEAVFFDCQLFPAPSPGSCLPRARP
ncbi:cell wall hydrolase [Parerythrobacter aurantius]|uniref:cell wall hydrolase n=1 Tax=Parerythrobacter aurantius TaxID=3127706 RepID=UPI00324EBFC4